MLLIERGYRFSLTQFTSVCLLGFWIFGWFCLGCRTDVTMINYLANANNVPVQDRALLLKTLWATKGEGWLLPPEKMKSGQMTSFLQSIYDKNGWEGRIGIHFSFDLAFRDHWLYAVNLTEGDRANFESLAQDMQDNMWYTVTRYCRRFGLNFRILPNEIVFYVPADYYSPDLTFGRSGVDGRLPDGRYRIADAFFKPMTTGDLFLLSTLKSRGITGLPGVPTLTLEEVKSIFKQDIWALSEITPPLNRNEEVPVEFGAEIEARGLIPICVDPVQKSIDDNWPCIKVPVLEYILQLCRTYGLKFRIKNAKIIFFKPVSYYSPDISKETVDLVPEIMAYEHELEQCWPYGRDSKK